MRILINTILFLIISTSVWASASPAIFYSDLISGPNTGGQNNNGVFVTIWGNNFGSTQGSSYVTVGGGKVNNYPTWTNTEICFQLGSLAATGNIVVTTSNGTSNGIPFTVRSGNIYFVQPGAATNGSGTYASPFNHLYYAYNIQTPGDTVYVLAGTIYDEIDGQNNWHSIIAAANSGTQAAPIAWVAYPNAIVTLQADGGTAIWTDGSSGGNDYVGYIFRSSGGSYGVISKFYLKLSGTGALGAVSITYYDGWRVVGNNVTGTTYPYDLIDFGGNNTEILGNEVHNSGPSNYNNEDHSIYWDAGGTGVEIGWNYFHDNSNVGWEISLYHQGSTSEPTRVGIIHDNIITNAGGNYDKGILIGDVDTGENETDVEGQNIQVYNNVIYNEGRAGYGGAIQAVSGTAYIYNNTIYQSPESSGTIQFLNTGIGPGGGNPVWYVANNIIYNSLSNALYVSDGGGNAPSWSNFALFRNNNYYGAGNGPSQDQHPVNANPQFVAPGTNFQLQATSPDLNAGYNTLSIVVRDLTGLLRDTTPSIGAYEYSSALPTPVVTINSPASGSSYTAGSNITITTTASENNGAISNIALYSGTGILLGSSNTSPYSYVYTNILPGSYTFYAVAKDANGNSTTSSSITVIITAPLVPTVAIINPANGTNLTAGSNITITATASETNGTISQVRFYNGTTLLGTDGTSPYSYTLTNASAGTYTLIAQATDANGISTTSIPITVNVNGLPVVSMGTNQAAYTAPASIQLTATASELSGTISKVEFFNGSTLLATVTGLYTYTWTNVPVGNYSLTAVAFDSNGNATTSAPASVTVSGAPVVSLATNGTSFTAPASINLTAAASEANGTIAVVYFYNGSTLLGSTMTSPYTFTWTNVPKGSYTLTAVAKDWYGVSTTSSAKMVTVTPSSSSPVVVMETNQAAYTAPATIQLTATASETNGTISKVEFFNGSTLLATVTGGLYTYTWTNVPVGNYSLTAVAFDSNGNSTTSAPASVTVSGAPVVSLATNGTSFTAPASITLTATASETNGTVAIVYFYNGSILLGSTMTSPYTYTWTSVSAGTYTLTAVAKDWYGVSTISSATPVTIASPSSLPVVTIASPANGSTFIQGSTFTITANASETGGTIAQVQYYSGTYLLASASTPPYTASWVNATTGTFTLTAKAIDTKGASTMSSPITITVTTALPVVSMGTNDAAYTAPASIQLTATASEANGGTITKVEFFNGSTLLATVTGGLYTYTWTNVPVGSYSLTAEAFDSKGNTTTSAPASVTVSGAPVVSLATNGTSFTAPASINLTATATEANGTIAIVYFYNGSTLLGSTMTSPYTYTWTNIPKGSYTLTAVAKDWYGVSTTSTAVNVKVSSPS